MHCLHLSLFSFLLFASQVLAGNVTEGGKCSVGNSRLQGGTFQFWSECDSVTFCSPQGFCEPRQCRQDDFPFGYKPEERLPPKCERGEFCPDEMSGCLPQIPVGQHCQQNRDDQCQGPDNFMELRDTSGRGLNYNGSVCINTICMFADVTAGNECQFENVAYIAYGVDGEFSVPVSRDNCRIGLYCDGSTKRCLQKKLLDEQCAADKECESYNCNMNGVCSIAAATPRHFGIWVYILVALGIIGGMVGTLTGLYFMHRKQRDAEREKRAQYWREQNAFHQNLTQMRETARAFILSLPQGKGEYSRDFGDEQHQGPKSSGLRHYVGDDSDVDDGLVMNQGPKGGRF